MALSVLTGSAVLFVCLASVFLWTMLREPFKVIVTPETVRVHLKEPFKLHLKVKNVSKENQHIETYLCSWYENWTTDSSVVTFPVWGCDVNPWGEFELAPGKSWEKDLDMTISKTIPTNHVSLHMGFRSSYKGVELDKSKYYWSNKVTIEVVP